MRTEPEELPRETKMEKYPFPSPRNPIRFLTGRISNEAKQRGGGRDSHVGARG